MHFSQMRRNAGILVQYRAVQATDSYTLHVTNQFLS
jgi:hypothetical protein